MKRTGNKEQVGHGMITLANRCAFALMVNSVNTACQFLHHQPEVPEEARKYRKF